MSDTVLGAAFVAGIACHMFYYKQYEFHLHPLRNLQAFLVLLSFIILAKIQYNDSPVREAIKSSLLLASIFLVGLYSSLLIYRLLFNPLNKIRGPFLARVSKFDHVFRNRHLDGHHQLLKLHRKYGQFVRIGPNDLSVTDPDCVQVISGPQSVCAKSPWYDNDVPRRSMHTTRSRAVHDQRRRIWAPGFSDKALRGYESRIHIYNDLLMKQIKAFSGKPVDVSKWFGLYAFDVMGDLAFGSSFDMLEKGEEHWAIALIGAGLHHLGFSYPTWFFRTLIAIPGATASYMKLVGFNIQQIHHRMEQGGIKQDQPDITGYLVEAYNAQENKTDALPLIQGDSGLIIAAGSDTTAAALTHLFYHLAAEPSITQKLRHELRGLLGDDVQVNHLKIQDAPFLNGCINETLRLNPPIPSGVFRKTPKEGVYVGETFIPGNTHIQMPGFVMGHDDAIYQFAESFLPERWSTQPDLILHKDAFQPFSSGPYGCIGKKLALMEIRTLTAQIVIEYEIAFASGEDGRRLLEDSLEHFTMGLKPMELVFKKINPC